MGRSLRDALLEEADSSTRQPPQQSDRRDSSTEGSSSPATRKKTHSNLRRSVRSGTQVKPRVGNVLDFDPTELVKNREADPQVSGDVPL